MAKIYFYDTSSSEKLELENGLVEHQPIFYTETLNESNIHEDAEIISIFVSSSITPAHIEKMPNLRLIACRSSGYNNVPLQFAHKKGIDVVVVPTYGEHTVAEYTFTLLLSLTRKIYETITTVKNHAHIQPEVLSGNDIFSKTLGVIGTGKIGKHVIEIAKGFGMNVVAYDPFPDNEASIILGYQYTSLDDLCMEADIITLHSPLTSDTNHLLNQKLFEKMKHGVFLINTARGELIDTEALLSALETGKVSGVALDVVEGENTLKEQPHVTNKDTRIPIKFLEESYHITKLASHPNVILTPHNAYNTHEAISRINQTTIKNIIDFLNGTKSNIAKPTNQTCGTLILVRHTESEYNKEGIWTGTRDVKLSQKGFEDARLLGNVLRDFTINQAYASEQVRTMETLSSILATIQQPVVPITKNIALNERDYGDYTGKNKHEMKELLGEDVFDKVRRGWDISIPNGETLKKVYERIVPFYKNDILPHLIHGENVLIVSHGNALRALIKYIENIDDTAIEHVEMMFGGALVYSVNDEGHSIHKEIRETPSSHLDTTT